jgi:hypothetical protein
MKSGGRYDEISALPIVSASFYLNPRWRIDYVEETRRLLAEIEAPPLPAWWPPGAELESGYPSINVSPCRLMLTDMPI